MSNKHFEQKANCPQILLKLRELTKFMWFLSHCLENIIDKYEA